MLSAAVVIGTLRVNTKLIQNYILTTSAILRNIIMTIMVLPSSLSHGHYPTSDTNC